MTSQPTPTNQFLVVTPSYNQGQFLAMTVDRVIQQADAEVDYWVMDAKSTDQSVSLLKKYGKKVHWKSEKDKGQTDAINKGIVEFKKHHAAEKAIFAYINSDDYYFPNAFEKVTQAFAAHPNAMWVVGDCQVIDAENREIHRPIRIYKKLVRWLYQPWMLAIMNPIPQPAVFIRWSAIQTLGDFEQNLRYTMDYEYWLRLQKLFGPPIMIDDTLAAFRVHGQSKGGTAFVKQFDEQYQVAQKYTQNGLLLLLHHLHNVLTKAIYEAIK